MVSPSKRPDHTHVTTTTTTLRFKHIIRPLIRVYTLGRTFPTDFIHGVGYRRCASSRCIDGRLDRSPVFGCEALIFTLAFEGFEHCLASLIIILCMRSA